MSRLTLNSPLLAIMCLAALVACDDKETEASSDDTDSTAEEADADTDTDTDTDADNIQHPMVFIEYLSATPLVGRDVIVEGETMTTNESGSFTASVPPLQNIELTTSGDDYPDAYYVEEEDCGGDTADSYESDAFEPVYEEDAEGDGYADEIAEETGSNDCTGDTSESYADDDGDCGGDTSDSYDDSYDDGDGCGGDTSDTSDSYDDGGDCGGDTSDTGSSSDSSDDCGGDTSDTGDDGCSISRRRRPRRPRLSIIVMALLGLVAPLRRATRPRQRQRSSLGVRLRRLARSLATSWRR